MKKLEAIIPNETKIETVPYETNFSQDISIDKTDLETEFLEHSEKFAWYAGLSEVAQARADRLKFDLDVLAAQLDVEKRTELNQASLADPKFKYTEKVVSNSIIGDVRYIKKMNEFLELQATANILNRAREAFNHRKEMLIQLANNSRVGDPRVKQEFAKAVLKRD